MGLFSAIRDFLADISPAWLVMAFAGPYVAGETADEVLAEAKKLHDEQGILVTADILGESSKDRGQTERWVSYYISLQKDLQVVPGAGVSVKPTAMGLLVSEEYCRENIGRIVSQSARIGRFVRIDMEDKTTTDATIRIYRHLRDAGLDNVGMVFQAYLLRTYDDIAALFDDGYKPNLRICKGIYKADRDFSRMADINDNFVRLTDLVVQRGGYPAIATHDILLIDRITRQVLKPAGISPRAFEWQMLLGVPVEQKQQELRRRGEKVRIYLPYGQRRDAAAYCKRRFKENPKLLYFIFKNLFAKN
ncbi:MAG: proline dehydrogenase family protein [Planctomycetota bacterium]|nr:proline dehydrogenase family protein [Planctomycetota bacterium]